VLASKSAITLCVDESRNRQWTRSPGVRWANVHGKATWRPQLAWASRNSKRVAEQMVVDQHPRAGAERGGNGQQGQGYGILSVGCGRPPGAPTLIQILDHQGSDHNDEVEVRHGRTGRGQASHQPELPSQGEEGGEQEHQ
jgi:hypothetical protein